MRAGRYQRGLTLLAFVGGCTCGAPEPPESSAPSASAPVGVEQELLPPIGPPAWTETRSEPDAMSSGRSRPKTIVFLVMDTVRGDHLSVCGYERPTSPTLDKLKVDGATVSCEAYTPAPWTLPSHASYFTGVPVPEHGSLFVSDSAIALTPKLQVRPLDEKFDTLAEQLEGDGYQTAFVSANPILKEESGVLQGFQKHFTSDADGIIRGKKVRQAVEKVLKELDPAKPLFLFVNIYDAHDPYPKIPAGKDWLPQRRMIRLNSTKRDPRNPMFRYMKGLMEPEESQKWLSALTDLYDNGISHADRNVNEVLGALKTGGWMDGTHRLLVTTDHGEYLGEHQMLRHGCFVHEEVTGGFLVYRDTSVERSPTLPAPLSLIDTFYLARDGRLPTMPTRAQAVSEPNPIFIEPGASSGAIWGLGDKAIWKEGEFSRIDLVNDPGEKAPIPLINSHIFRPPLMEMVERIQALEQLPVPEAGMGMDEALKAVGYIE
jgi:hypothetical protein